MWPVSNENVEVMAKFLVQGYIRSVRYLQDACLVFVDEFKQGFKRGNGEVVDDKYIQWKIVFKGYFKNYINKHFSDGRLVDIYAEVLPYAIEHDEIVDGYSCIGKTIDRSSYPRSGAKQEIRMVKESQLHSNAQPDLDRYNEPDF